MLGRRQHRGRRTSLGGDHRGRPVLPRRPHPVRGPDLPGSSGRLDQSSAIGQLGDVQIELFEQHCDNPSGARDMFAPGETGVQHITWFDADLDAETARLQDLGFPVVKTCRLPAMGGMRLAWFDTRPVFGVMLEVYEESDLMRRLYAKVARAAHEWDGSDPLRHLA